MTLVQRYYMQRVFVVAEFCLDASVRQSLIEMSPGQRTVIRVLVQQYRSMGTYTEYKTFSENRTSRRTCCNSMGPTSIETAHTSKNYLDIYLMEQGREFKAAVEFWQPANIGAVSVCSFARVYKLREAHSCRAVSVFIHRQCVNKKSKTST